MVDKRLALALQLVAAVAAVAFIADEWSDHTLRARVREWIERQAVEPEPEPVEVMPTTTDVADLHTELRRITERG